MEPRSCHLVIFQVANFTQIEGEVNLPHPQHVVGLTLSTRKEVRIHVGKARIINRKSVSVTNKEFIRKINPLKDKSFLFDSLFRIE